MRALLLAALVASGGAAAAPDVLDPRAYRFCHDAGADAEEARVYCPLLADLPPETCPGLRATCAGAEEPESGCDQPLGGPPSGSLAAPPKPEWHMPDLGCSPGDLRGLTVALQWGVAILVAIVILAIARILAKRFGRTPPRAPTRPIPATDTVPPEAPGEDVPDLPSADLLASAKAAFAEGRYGHAVLLARGAALRRLAERGRLTLHRARTDREYVRSVRQDAAVHDDLRVIVGGAEAHRWGGRPVDATVARGVLEAAARLVALCALIAALLPGDARAGDRYGATGDAGLHDLLAGSGYAVSWRTDPLAELSDATRVLVLDAARVDPTPDDWNHVRLWVEAGGVLVAAGPTAGWFPELGATEDHTQTAPLAIEGWAAEGHLPPPVWPDGPRARYVGDLPPITGITLPLGPPPSAEPPRRVPLVVDADGMPVVLAADAGEGIVVGIPDERLITNGALLSPANRAFLADLIQVGAALDGWELPEPLPVELATRSFALGDGPQGSACQNAESLANGRLLALVLQALALWGLVALWRGWQFGVPRDPPQAGRIAFADHVEALARRLARLDRPAARDGWRRPGTAGRAWAERARVRLLWSRLGASGIEAAALRGGWSAADARDLAARIERVADGGDDPAAVEAVWRLVK